MLTCILFSLGIFLILIPAQQKKRSTNHIEQTIKQYEKAMENVDTQRQKQLALQYNEKRNQKEAVSQQEYVAALDILDGIMGVLSIPDIDINLPIYHGVSEEVLRKGAGHMPESALPIGGEGNHTVLAGHTGLAGAELFTDLTQLEEGDIFTLSVLGETLYYRIERIKTVRPDAVEELERVDGKDCCTLVTCTPYGVNSHRLLVRGTRVDNLP